MILKKNSNEDEIWDDLDLEELFPTTKKPFQKIKPNSQQDQDFE